MVTGAPHIRFYAAAPLVTASGHAIGRLCVLDHEPCPMSSDKLEELRFLAQQVITTMEQRQLIVDSRMRAGLAKSSSH